ncbi:MOLPALP family lipoprotein [Mycoplasma feriruminatoris]|uniref:MOLPALP family lipoprotein n=1 Tax=Mycoplasma feriruminatoris TaxID=1179777 RepID=A0AAQ3DPH2_9MOLU|nr:MOLPALP family lipoprotein [Mycoplasma feriruminatoris]WFQ95066.1 MOLPALP family lipoprotein [Mycoplasma feriruminatoris]
MKKLIAILSSFMMIITASLLIISCQTKQFKFETNNSIINTQTIASLFARQLILADQLKVDLNKINNDKETLSVLLKENNLKLDNLDKSINDLNDLDDLVDKYFEKDSYKKFLNQNIKQNIKNNLNNPVFKEIFKFFGLKETDIDKFSDDILDILNLTLNLNPIFAFSTFDKIDSNLKAIFLKIKPSFSNWIKTLNSSKENLLKKVEDFQNKIDVNTKYKDLKAQDLDAAFYISLINVISLAFSIKEFELVEINVKNINESLLKASNLLNKVLSFSENKTDNKTNIIEIICYILQALQFLQIKLSLFEDTRNYTPESKDKLFNKDKTNHKFIQDLYKNKTIKTITNQKPSSINLKYILSFFKNAVNELKDENKKDGIELQKLLAMLFLSTQKVKYRKDIDEQKENKEINDYYKNLKAHPLVSLLVDILKNYLSKNLKLLLEKQKITSIEIDKFIDESITYLYKWISFALNSLLSSSYDAHEILDILFVNVIPKILNSLQTNTDILKPYINQALILSIPPFLFMLFSSKLDIAFPILTDKKIDVFKVLYSGDIFLVNKLDDMFDTIKDTFKTKLEPLFGDQKISYEIIKKYFDLFKEKYNFVFKNIKHFNLKTLLTTCLNKINQTKWKNINFLKPLQSKSIADILDTLINTFNVQNNEKLDQLQSSNINLTSLNDVAKIIVNYTYKTKDLNYKNKNLIDILKSNPDKTLEILGWTSDKNNPINKESLIDEFLTKIFNLKTNNSEDVLNQIEKITNLLNEWFVGKITKSDILITFNFTNTKKNKLDQLLSQTLIASVKNKITNTQTQYTFSYSRDKQSKFKFTEISKK